MQSERIWSLVLAGGEGTRLRALTTRPGGTPIPKQFCSFISERTLLEEAIERAKAFTPPEQTCVIVAADHRRWWSPTLARLPKENVIAQPCNRGTAIGILYPLLHILARDPQSRLVILPSDHYVRHEEILQHSVRAAAGLLDQGKGGPILLGLEPEEPDPELGYIVPGEPGIDGGSIRRFVEKPPAHVAREIITEGGLWNAFIIVTTGQHLLELFEHRYPRIVRQMRSAVEARAREPESAGHLQRWYERLPQIDFSRDVLEASSASLRVVRVPACGWSDLGTPKRVAETLRRLGPVGFRTSRGSTTGAPLDLAKQYAQLAQQRFPAAGLGRIQVLR